MIFRPGYIQIFFGVRIRPRRKHAKYFDTRSGRIRLAMIANNSAKSIEAFAKANVKRGTTLIINQSISKCTVRRHI